MWPSQDHFSEYINSGKKLFRGSYVSAWNASLQREVYYSAWGMDIKQDVPVAVGSKDMKIGMPYFTSPDAESVVTWVGEIPESITFELKAPGITSFNENYIVLPLNTVIRTAKDLCDDLIAEGIMTGDDSIARWDVSKQKIVDTVRCSDDFVGHVKLEPAVPYLITVSNSGSWTQK